MHVIYHECAETNYTKALSPNNVFKRNSHFCFCKHHFILDFMILDDKTVQSVACCYFLPLIQFAPN